MSDMRKKYSDMKVVDLRQELDRLGMDRNGVKMILVERLLKHFENKSEESSPEQTTANNTACDDSLGNTLAKTNLEVEDEIPESNDDDTVLCDDGVENEFEQEQEGDEEEEEVEYTNEDNVENEDHDESEDYVENENLVEKEDVQSEKVELDKEVEHEEELEQVKQVDTNMEIEDDEHHDKQEKEHKDEDEVTNTMVKAQIIRDDDEESDSLRLTIEENEKLAPDENGLSNSGEEESSHRFHEQNQNTVNRTTPSSVDKEKSNKTASSNEAGQDTNAREGERDHLITKSKDGGERHIILVTGLSAETSANDLKSHFRKHGKIGRIKIMTNTRVPGSQRFAHISVMSIDDLNYLVNTLNGVELRGKPIRVTKAPDGGSIARSYEMAVEAARTEITYHTPNKNNANRRKSGEVASEDGESTFDSHKKDNNKGGVEKADIDDIQQVSDESQKDMDVKNSDTEKKAGSSEKKKEEKESPSTKTRSPDKTPRIMDRLGSRPRRESHERPPRLMDHHMRDVRPAFRRDKDATEWKRHGYGQNRMEITRVPRDRMHMNRGGYYGGVHHPPITGGRRRSPHAPTLTFEQIREIRDEQRKREVERRKREEERERAAETERQKRLEYQNYMEFKQLEREREKLKMERERIEREKQDLIRMERERQKSERERIEREKEELRRAKMNMEHQAHARSSPMKRPYDEDKDRRRELDDRKKPFTMDSERRVRMDMQHKTEAERKIERERYERHHTLDPRGRSPSPRDREMRDTRRDSGGWGVRDERKERMRPEERISHRREIDTVKISERRTREAPSRTVTLTPEIPSRYPAESLHSSTRSSATAVKRIIDRYDDTRSSSARDDQWMQRSTSSYLTSGSSLSTMQMSSSSVGSRDSWPVVQKRELEWDTSRLPARTDGWSAGGVGSTSGTSGRASLPVIAPPPPIYSSVSAASLALPGSSIGLGGYTSDRFDTYKLGFHNNVRRY